jgi:hypothetical protein
MVKNRDQVADRPGVAIVHNIDGFGTADQKKNIYVELVYHKGAGTTTTPPSSGRFNGFKLFYKEDKGLMTPAQALGLEPSPDVIVYE